MIIRGGTTVTVGGRAIQDVGIRDGRIAQLGGVMDAEHVIDAAQLIVTPGDIKKDLFQRFAAIFFDQPGRCSPINDLPLFHHQHI